MMTFVELWKAAPQHVRSRIVSDIAVKGVALSTAYAYCNGTRTPMLLMKEHIQKLVKIHFKIKAPIEELFPS